MGPAFLSGAFERVLFLLSASALILALLRFWVLYPVQIQIQPMEPFVVLQVFPFLIWFVSLPQVFVWAWVLTLAG